MHAKEAPPLRQAKRKNDLNRRRMLLQARLPHNTTSCVTTGSSTCRMLHMTTCRLSKRSLEDEVGSVRMLLPRTQSSKRLPARTSVRLFSILLFYFYLSGSRACELFQEPLDNRDVIPAPQKLTALIKFLIKHQC